MSKDLGLPPSPSLLEWPDMFWQSATSLWEEGKTLNCCLWHRAEGLSGKSEFMK